MIKLSALEIYNEVVKDLLNPESGPLRLLDDPEVCSSLSLSLSLSLSFSLSFKFSLSLTFIHSIFPSASLTLPLLMCDFHILTLSYCRTLS